MRYALPCCFLNCLKTPTMKLKVSPHYILIELCQKYAILLIERKKEAKNAYKPAYFYPAKTP